MTDLDYEELFRNAPFGYVTLRADGAVEAVNDTLLRWVDRDRDAVAGQPFAALLDGGSRLFWETRHSSVLWMRGEAREVALTLLGRDGPMPVLANSTVAVDAQGEATRVRVALLSTPERLEYERALLESTRSAERTGARLAVLQSAGSALIGAVSERQVADSLVASASEAFDASTVTVFLFDEAGELRSVAGKERIPAPDGGAWLSITERRAVTVSDIAEGEQQFPRFTRVMRDDRIAAFSAVPLIADGPAFGALLCTFARPRPIDAELVEVQAALALQAAQALVRLRLQARLEKLALHDPLTGLANRQLLHERLVQALAVAARSGEPVSVLFLDMDGFKQINDRDGHAAGDAALIEVARRLGASVRTGDVCARYGGDEFVVICAGADEVAARSVAERIRESMTRPFTMTATRVSASIGIAVVHDAPVTADAVLEHADAAMYRSKQEGRDRITTIAAT